MKVKILGMYVMNGVFQMNKLKCRLPTCGAKYDGSHIIFSFQTHEERGRTVRKTSKVKRQTKLN